MSETLEAFIQRKSDPKWKPKALPKPSTKLRKFTPNDVARDMSTYEYSLGFDYRRITNGSQLTLQGFLDAKAGHAPYKPKKLPTLGSPGKLTANARASEARLVREWNDMTPEKRVRQLEDARRMVQKDWSR